VQKFSGGFGAKYSFNPRGSARLLAQFKRRAKRGHSKARHNCFLRLHAICTGFDAAGRERVAKPCASAWAHHSRRRRWSGHRGRCWQRKRRRLPQSARASASLQGWRKLTSITGIDTIVVGITTIITAGGIMVTATVIRVRGISAGDSPNAHSVCMFAVH
jgi:hypothetical protein